MKEHTPAATIVPESSGFRIYQFTDSDSIIY